MGIHTKHSLVYSNPLESHNTTKNENNNLTQFRQLSRYAQVYLIDEELRNYLFDIETKSLGLPYLSRQISIKNFHRSRKMRMEKISNFSQFSQNISAFFSTYLAKPQFSNQTKTNMSNKPATIFDKASTFCNLRALAKAGNTQTNFISGKADIIDNNLDYRSVNAVFQAANESDLTTKAAVLNINSEGELTILSCFFKHAGGKWFAIETTPSGVSSTVRVEDKIKNTEENDNDIPPTKELLTATSNEEMMKIISNDSNRTLQATSSTVIVDWEVIQGIFLGPNSVITYQDILWHYVSLAKSDSTLADSNWFKRICNTVLQAELAQQDSAKSPGLATKPIRPDGKTHWKTIELVTNEFNSTTNDNDAHMSETESKSDISEDSTDEREEGENWKANQLAASILATIPNSNTDAKPYDQVSSENDEPSTPERRKRAKSASTSPSRRDGSKRGKSSHNSRDRDTDASANAATKSNEVNKEKTQHDEVESDEFTGFDNNSMLRFFTLNAQKDRLKETYIPKIELYVKKILLKVSANKKGIIPANFNDGLESHLKSGKKLQSIQGSMEDTINSMKGRREESIGPFDIKLLEKVFSGKLANDTAISDPASFEGISPFSFLPFGEEHNTKSKAGQSLFIPGDCDQLFQVMRAMSLFITEIFSKESEFSSKFEFLYEDFLDIRKALKAKFQTHGKDFGRYICLLVHNVVGQFIRDMKERIRPSSRHINLDSLIEQIQIGATITIPSNKPTDRHNRDDQRNNRNSYNDRQNNSFNNNRNNGYNNRDRYQSRGDNRDNNRQPYGRAPRQQGRYEFKESENYGAYFHGDKIRTMRPPIPSSNGKNICLKNLFIGSCTRQGCTNFHGSTTSMDTQIKSWIDGNNLPVKKRES